MVELSIATVSKPGGRTRNEDVCGYRQTEGSICCVLCDGAGGHGGGDRAAQLAVEAVLRHFEAAKGDASERIAMLIDEANRAVVAGQVEGGAYVDMRSTVATVICNLEESSAAWGHVGDSRIYCFRNGWIIGRTKDHSMVQSLVDARLYDPAKPGSVQRNVLTSSLGSEEEIMIDILDKDLVLQPGDAFLLCSDGFWGALAERQMEEALQEAADPASWLGAMEEIILATAGPTQDNYSAIGLWMGQIDPVTQVLR